MSSVIALPKTHCVLAPVTDGLVLLNAITTGLRHDLVPDRRQRSSSDRLVTVSRTASPLKMRSLLVTPVNPRPVPAPSSPSSRESSSHTEKRLESRRRVSHDMQQRHLRDAVAAFPPLKLAFGRRCQIPPHTSSLQWCRVAVGFAAFLHHNSLAGALSKAIANVAVLDLTENSRHYWCLYS